MRHLGARGQELGTILFNILIYLFSPRNSPNRVTDLCTTSRDGCYYSELELTLSSAEGLGVIIKIALGLELRMSWRPC